jgi:DNA-binding transcriptional MerR regulator
LDSKNNKIEFLTIGDVSEKTGVKPYILRYWEKEFPFLQPLKNKAGHRLYSPRDIFIIQNIKTLLYTKGYSISGAKRVLWDALLGKKDSDLQQQLEDIKKELHEMLKIINKSLKS